MFSDSRYRCRFVLPIPTTSEEFKNAALFLRLVLPSKLICQEKEAFSKHLFKGAQSRLKSLAQLFKFVVCNPRQSSPSLTILVPLWFIIFTSARIPLFF